MEFNGRCLTNRLLGRWCDTDGSVKNKWELSLSRWNFCMCVYIADATSKGYRTPKVASAYKLL